MTELEKVIKGLECRLDINGSKYKHCLTCDYRHDIDHCQWACQTDGILEDALALLKAQEPRVLSVDEWCNDRTTPDDGTPLCYEVREASGRCYIKWMLEKVFKRVPEYYGVHFRCWTSKPTDEQRKNTPWIEGD